MHPRNRHQGHYDFDALLALTPALQQHIITTPYGERSIDFSQPSSVRALNAALLRLHYGVQNWDLPQGYLCPPVPGRADYVHGLADLLAEDHQGVIPRGAGVRALDIGVGANCIYPLIAHAEYGWQMVGTDIDPKALTIAQSILDHNTGFAQAIELRVQQERTRIFEGLLKSGERFALSLCNPPFHASAQEAARGSTEKWRKLGKSNTATSSKTALRRPPLNFGGQSNELWCPGGEAGFIRRMIEESAGMAERIGWFSSLVAKSEHLAPLRQRLSLVGALEVREMRMAQGSKQSRFLAWSFLDPQKRVALSAP
ncbi:23S rRNA (adenine(1618)-N(6))-methyltransferase RlmF [Pseudomarimonas arenosa]|uniref:23S rRNA (adenine(1618)-N(6))-methyltransferase RlmF n=1 Tax=Pseudomarimonas arenosa TaxID=2774145 RepID=UPI001E3CCB6C|nr:23S rRNA (adenine(1618)-N(6))-methyltransferase RlmF [Pseudomarimonas arenosa]